MNLKHVPTGTVKLIESLMKRYPRHEFGPLDKADSVECDNYKAPEVLVAFTHNGTVIHDPFVSECGRFVTHPAYYGIDYDHAVMICQHNGGDREN